MRIFLVLFTLISHAHCYAQFDLEDPKDTTPVEMADLTIENLQGAWKRGNRRRYDLAGDEEYETVVELQSHLHRRK